MPKIKTHRGAAKLFGRREPVNLSAPTPSPATFSPKIRQAQAHLRKMLSLPNPTREPSSACCMLYIRRLNTYAKSKTGCANPSTS